MRKAIKVLTFALMLLSLCSIAYATVTVAPEAEQGKINFSDVENHWAAQEISFVGEKELMKGYPDGTFKPDKNLNRLELVVVLDRVFDFNFSAVTFVKEPEVKDMFDDVYDGKWYSTSLLETTFFGVMNTDDRLFRPDRVITRIEVAKAIQQSFTAKKLSVTMTQIFPTYKDTENLSADESSALNFVFNTGIMKGRGNNSFGPNEPITRAELAAVLKRAMQTIEIAESIEERPQQ